LLEVYRYTNRYTISVYEIRRCSCGKVYNDKTGENVSTCFEEHESHIHSAIAEHQKNTRHKKILFDLEIIGAKTRGHFLRKYRESIEILKNLDMHINSWQRCRPLTLFRLEHLVPTFSYLLIIHLNNFKVLLPDYWCTTRAVCRIMREDIQCMKNIYAWLHINVDTFLDFCNVETSGSSISRKSIRFESLKQR
jgi:hypothetical protein